MRPAFPSSRQVSSELRYATVAWPRRADFPVSLMGHLAAPDALESVWRDDLLPLLEEYFVGDTDGLAEAQREWTRIMAVLDSSTSG